MRWVDGSPADAPDAPELREVVTWGTAFKLAYLWGPEGIIVELAEKL